MNARLEAAARALYESINPPGTVGPWDRLNPEGAGRRPWLAHAAKVLAAADAHDKIETDYMVECDGRLIGRWEPRIHPHNYRRRVGPWEPCEEVGRGA